MSQVLSQLLGVRPLDFRYMIDQLEQAAGAPKGDIRLLNQVSARSKRKVLELGLDPLDTTSKELFYALHSRLLGDERATRKTLGIADTATNSQIVHVVVAFLEQSSLSSRCYSLKTSVAKRLILQNPPTVAMKALGYRSVSSFTRSQNISEIYAAAQVLETASWHQALWSQYQKLSASDFEPRLIHLVIPESKNWPKVTSAFVDEGRRNILVQPELGSVTILQLPDDAELPGLTITLLLLILEAYNDIHVVSSFLKMHQVRPDFGQTLVKAVQGQLDSGVQFAGETIPWRIIHRFFAHHPERFPVDVFEPHVQTEDLAWVHGSSALTKAIPELAFWQGSADCGYADQHGAVSFNMLDVGLSVCNRLPYANRILDHFHDNLWHELRAQYLRQDYVAELIINQCNRRLLSVT